MHLLSFLCSYFGALLPNLRQANQLQVLFQGSHPSSRTIACKNECRQKLQQYLKPTCGFFSMPRLPIESRLSLRARGWPGILSRRCSDSGLVSDCHNDLWVLRASVQGRLQPHAMRPGQRLLLRLSLHRCSSYLSDRFSRKSSRSICEIRNPNLSDW